MRSKTLLLSSLAIATAAVSARADSVVITSPLLETFGTEKAIPAGGTASNTDTWAEGLVAAFAVQFTDVSANTITTEYMTVSVSLPAGSGLSAGTDSLMAIQTVNSQGLTDSGTFSIYVREFVEWSLNVEFSFWDDYTASGPVDISDFSNPLVIDDLRLTSFDIDNSQRYLINNTQLTEEFKGTALSSSVIAPFTQYTSPGSSGFDNPDYAVVASGTGSEFSIQLRHNAVALYMFEFRDISAVIPEPSFAALGLLAFSGVALRRRRS